MEEVSWKCGGLISNCCPPKSYEKADIEKKEE